VFPVWLVVVERDTEVLESGHDVKILENLTRLETSGRSLPELVANRTQTGC
jgi:hypothetical protein